ncbi:MAG: glycosyltransferase family 39 protein, partial [Planctomycetaceae bacterium]|nr:glycosyltransferase family 39 protein [Planctomycetaceae bacterium]
MSATHGEEQPDQLDRTKRLAMITVSLGALLLRLYQLDQPIVENYVGRQIPTAMVARNLERGSGFLHPQLDTAPFPSYFLVEPPVFQLGAVVMRRITGWPLEVCGRILSSAAIALGGWGLFELVRRREGSAVALAALTAFSFFPICTRYGRAFQPDGLMLGAVLAGVSCWDRASRNEGWGWAVAAWLWLAIGFAAKVTSVLVLIPLASMTPPPRQAGKCLLAISVMGPVLLWYLWANHLTEAATGSRAAAENRSIWIGVLGLGALARAETWAHIGRFLLLRAFTPLGVLLGIWGLWKKSEGRSSPRAGWFDLWRLWGLSVLLVMAVLAGKLHHEYYWLILAPAIAVGVGRTWTNLAHRRPRAAWGVGLAHLFLCGLLARSTFQTPKEWENLTAAAHATRQLVARDDLLVAPEPLLYLADRRGCRLEYSSDAAVRAAAEWPQESLEAGAGPLELIEFYRARGARFLA